jgi:hypothetical protein
VNAHPQRATQTTKAQSRKLWAFVGVCAFASSFAPLRETYFPRKGAKKKGALANRLVRTYSSPSGPSGKLAQVSPSYALIHKSS